MTHKITREYEKKMSEISPFELKNILIDLADESARKSTHIMLNAGRGNPNWISTVPREAFFLLGQFGLEGSIGRRLPEAGIVRQPPAQREVRSLCYRRGNRRDVLYIRFSATKFPSW